MIQVNEAIHPLTMAAMFLTNFEVFVDVPT